MTTLTQKEFDALPEYSCSFPTFHENWLNPGRYWKSCPGQFPDLRRLGWEEGRWYIWCYVANSVVGDDGCFDLGKLFDEIQVTTDDRTLSFRRIEP